MTASVPSYTEKTWQGDGSTTVFNFQTRVDEAADLKVWLIENDVETLKSLTTHYTLSGLGSPSGVAVTLLTAATAVQTVKVRRDTVPKQTIDYSDLGKVPGNTTEAQLDRLAMVGQDLQSRLDLIETIPDIGGLVDDFDKRYLGAFETDPTTDNDGEALTDGALYFNTDDGVFRVWNGLWQNQAVTVADGDVTEPKHATGGVSTRALAALSVTTAKLADEAVTLAKIDDDAKADFRMVDPNGPRLPWKYHGATTMQVTGVQSLAMGGFRVDGRYTEGRVPVFDAPAFTSQNRHVLSLGNGTSTAGDLFVESWHVKSNWYALFAAADDGDATFDFGFMPWFRVGSIAGNVITLNQGGENQRSVAGKTYQLATNELVGAKVWVRTETLDGRANAFSNRLTEVTANTATTITLADVGAMAVYDYFLVAPPGYDHFVYLCTGYMDTAELRNIADAGDIVGSRGAANTQANISGNVATSVAVPVDGHISPAATAVVFSHSDTHSTSSGGDSVIRYGMDDGNHDTHEFYYHKDGSASQAFTFQFPPVPFSFFPKLYFYSGGSLNGATNTRAMNIRGWLEP